MFRRLVTSLPEDPKFPHNLKRLGYEINSDGFIKKIEFPDDDFQFHITNNERYNDVHREAMHSCIRREVRNRLIKLSINDLYLPTLTSFILSADFPSLPIACTPRRLLSCKQRIIVLMNRQFEDLAILSYRLLSKIGGIDAGSAVAFVQEIVRRSGGDAEADGTPGVLILNPGQLLYSFRNKQAMTQITWDAMARKSAVHPMPLVHAELNRVEGNGTVQEHLDFVFSRILCSQDFVAQDAEIYLVGLGDGGDELVKYLEANWQTLQPRLQLRALALTAPLSITRETSHIPLTNRSFLEFMATRAKAWAMSSEPVGELVADSNVLSELDGDEEEVSEGGVGWEEEEIVENVTIDEEVLKDIMAKAEILEAVENLNLNGLPINEPSINEPSINEPSINEPSINEPSINEPSINEPSINEPSINEPSINEPSINEPSINEPSINEPSINEPSINEPSINEPSINEPSIDEPSTSEPSANEPSTNEPSTNEPSTDKPTTNASSTNESSTEHSTELPSHPPTNELSTNGNLTNEPSTTLSFAKASSTNESSTSPPSSTEPSTFTNNTSTSPSITPPSITPPSIASPSSTSPSSNIPTQHNGSHNHDHHHDHHMATRPIRLCPTISSGEELYAECVFPRVYGEVLDWFQQMAGM